MRYVCASALAMSLLCGSPRSLLAQGSIDGFGALSVNKLSSFEGAPLPVDWGGRVSVELVPGIDAIGEVGRIGNVLPMAVGTLLSFAPVDVGVSAFYGEGGVRLCAAPRSAVTPYVEATAGIARLDFNIGGLGGTTGAVTRAALNLLDRTEPIAGAGGGVMLRGGPVLVDLGYRYKQVFSKGLVGTLLTGGQDLRLHQVRFGLGVRF